MMPSFLTDMSRQTEQIQIKLLLEESLNSVCIFFSTSLAAQPYGRAILLKILVRFQLFLLSVYIARVHKYQRTIGPVNAHLISWPSKAQSIQNLENLW